VHRKNDRLFYAQKFKEKEMKKKSLLLGMLVIVLAFGMSVVGCDDGGGGGDEGWTNVTSLSQVNGTWKGSYSQSQSQGGLTMKNEAQMTYIINASAKTVTMSQTQIMSLSGTSSLVDAYWPMMKQGFTAGTETETDEDGNPYTITTTINDSKHTITRTMSPRTMSITDDDIDEMKSRMEISKDGKKLKQLISEEDGEKEYIIFTKQ
jgi:hypothetical protein